MDTVRTKKDIIASHTFTYFNFLNVVLAGLIVLSGQYKNMLFMGIVISNALIGIIQELKVKKLIDALSVVTATKAKKICGDTITEVRIEELQIGDCIRIVAGDQIPVDCKTISSEGLEVNESLLTGEALAVLKKEEDVLYSGSNAVAGSAVGQVVHTGEDNYATQLVKKAKTKRRATSEMQIAIKRIIKYVGYAILPIGLALFFIQRHVAANSISNSLVNTVAGVLGMIPEGLVLLTSISFILGVGRLARKNALVQEMEAIEALARVDVLCLDKTGTITTGTLRVEEVLYAQHNLCGQDTVSYVDKCADKCESGYTDRYADGCTDKYTTKYEQRVRCILESITYAFEESNNTSDALRNYFSDTHTLSIVDKQPFSSQRKYMSITIEENNQNHTYFLGAPEYLTDEPEELKKAERYANEGMRVLLLADEFRSPMALIVLSDIIKEDAPDTFCFFREKNVDIKIVSGDNPVTVSIIAGKAGLEHADRYIDARELPDDMEMLKKEVDKYSVFGRVSPEKKQQIIKALEENGKVTGMVGDGVNDVLALKDADCGIAMASGSDAAKQSAHIVLLNSDFSSMKDIVNEGRTIISNIERVSVLYLTKTIYSIMLCALFIILGRSYPFIPIQLSLIGATAIGIPSFILALERHEDTIPKGFLKNVLRISLPAAALLTGGLVTISFLQRIFHLSELAESTLNLLAGACVSFGVLLIACIPMSRMRFLLCTFVITVFCAALLLFPHFFGVVSIFDWIAGFAA